MIPEINPGDRQPLSFTALETMYHKMLALRSEPPTYFELVGWLEVKDNPRYNLILKKVKALIEDLPPAKPHMADAFEEVMRLGFGVQGISPEEIAFGLWRKGYSPTE